MTCSRQSTGVAMGKYASPVGQQFRTISAHRPIDANVLRSDFMRFGQQPIGNLTDGETPDTIPHRPHALESPEQVHCRGSAGGQYLKSLLHLCRKLCGRRVPQAQGFHGNTVSGGTADRRRPSHHHGTDTFGSFAC